MFGTGPLPLPLCALLYIPMVSAKIVGTVITRPVDVAITMDSVCSGGSMKWTGDGASHGDGGIVRGW